MSLSHASLLSQVSETYMRSDDMFLTFSTLYWISGLILMISCTINGVCRLITTEPFTAKLMLEMIEEHKVTFIFSASHFLALTLKSEQFYVTDLSSLRVILCSGSKLSTKTAKEFLKHLPNCKLFLGYGMTEMGGLLSCHEVDESYGGSLGKLIKGTKIKIINDNGERLSFNEIGEICVKCQHQFLNYYQNEEATKNVIDDDGFLQTGDMGYFDDSNNIYLVDRKKDIMKYCSSQVSPTEIEDLLIQMPGIKAVCVVGIPDSIVGDLPAAVIIRTENGAHITNEEIENVVSGDYFNFIFFHFKYHNLFIFYS